VDRIRQRLLNFPLVAIAGLTFIAFLMWHRHQRAAGAPGRRDLVRLSAILPSASSRRPWSAGSSC